MTTPEREQENPRTLSIWETLGRRIERKEVVPEDQLLMAEESEEIPEDLRAAVELIMSAPVPRGRPRQTREEWAPRLAESVELATEVRLRQVGFRLQGYSDPGARAIESVAREHEIGPEMLRRDRLRRELKPFPRVKNLIPTLDEAHELIQEMLEAGLVRLDPDVGCVRCPDEELLEQTTCSPEERALGPRKANGTSTGESVAG